ncbi:uncharacterized protein FIBRA_00547 [Fibroporia radiculosa]|uniref:Pyridoxamine 5'-phosphate oxidase Alr4036 family FMN-binding domain-containing protein n=1 Tax=Fibroporia radiculosa TaxID=599839 RepID=J4HRS6_9APHY|nr:uncharacterized protein FIBRA_00547 [Fibroporia radiculosa]CCL98547.1 predicted protein [Fibroporia radiculosa]
MASMPRWRSALSKALSLPENQGQNLYQLATTDSGATAHARTLVHRDILQPAGFPQLPIILTTTDIRTPKVVQLRAHPQAELCWWMAGSSDQFRLLGPVRIVSSPHADPQHAPSLWTSSLAFDKMDAQRFDWEKQRLEVFDNMSAHMKASWCRPPPGSVMESYEDAKKWPQTVPKLGEAETEEDKRNQEQALRNFCTCARGPRGRRLGAARGEAQPED